MLSDLAAIDSGSTFGADSTIAAPNLVAIDEVGSSPIPIAMQLTLN